MKTKIREFRYRINDEYEDLGEVLNAVEVANADEKQEKSTLDSFTIKRRYVGWFFWYVVNVYFFVYFLSCCSDLNNGALGRSDAGHGLFTTSPVVPGQRIVYWGYLITDSQVDDLSEVDQARALDTGMFTDSKTPEGIVGIGSLGCMATSVCFVF